MRWYVEIAAVGKDPPQQKLCLEATHWQPALQRARKLRGEDEKLGGLSVEFLEDGCRAIDAALRSRYVVSKAPDDAPLVEDPAAGALAPPRPSEPRKKKKRKFRENRSPSAELLRRKRSTQDFVSPGVMRESDAPPGEIVLPDPEAPPVPPSQKAAAAPAPSGARANEIVHKIVADEHRPPTETTPIAYHERALALVRPIELADIAGLFRDQLEEVRRQHPSDGGKRLVHLGLFDHVYKGNPERPPIATLEWREWHA